MSKMKHVFKGTKLGWKREQEGIWFDSDHYTKEEAESEFVEKTGYTEKANGESYPYTYYEYDGQKYYKVNYIGEYEEDNLPGKDKR